MIHTPEHILQRLDFIQSILESHYDSDDGQILNQRLQDISIYMAEAGKLKADSVFHHANKLRSDTIKALKDLIPEWSSAGIQNAIIKGCAADELRMVEYADRVNRSCTHQIEAMRTQLSYIKSLANFER